MYFSNIDYLRKIQLIPRTQNGQCKEMVDRNYTCERNCIYRVVHSKVNENIPFQQADQIKIKISLFYLFYVKQEIDPESDHVASLNKFLLC